MLVDAVESYLAVRRATGFALKCTGSLLHSFAVFSEALRRLREVTKPCSPRLTTDLVAGRIGTVAG